MLSREDHNRRQRTYYYANHAAVRQRVNARRNARRAESWAPSPDLPGEIWHSIRGWEELYQASNKGRIRRVGRAPGIRSVPYVLRPSLGTTGYYFVALSQNNRVTRSAVHRLVASAFLGYRPRHIDVNHIDGCKTNNLLENLEWATRAENQLHSARIGLMATGEQHSHAKLKAIDIPVIRASDESDTVLADRFGVARGVIWSVRKRHTWKHIP